LSILFGLLVLAALLMPGVCLGVPLPPSISGTITDSVTHAPIPWANVSLYMRSEWGSSCVGHQTTDVNGHYSFFGLAEGSYQIDFTDSSHFFETYDNHDLWSAADWVEVRNGSSVLADAQLDPVPALTADAFESDDTFTSAALTKADGAKVRHTHYPRGDSDFVKFPVKAGHLYQLNSVARQYANGHYLEPYNTVYGQDRRPVYYKYGYGTFLAERDGYAYGEVKGWGGNGFYDLAVVESMPGRIAGTVIADDTQQPLEDATVELAQVQHDAWGEWEWWVDSTTTNSDGKYSFRGLPAGNGYQLRFARAGYAAEWYDDEPVALSPWESRTKVTLEEGKTTTADAGLAPAGHISGVVTDEQTGEPLAGVGVEVYSSSMSGYHIAYAEADRLGRYEVKSLAPGSYKLRFYDTNDCYDNEWFDDAWDFQDAADVTVEGGDTALADASLWQRWDAAMVSGVVTDRANGKPLQGVMVHVEQVGPVEPSDGPFGGMRSLANTYSTYHSGYSTYTQADGSYRIGGIASENPWGSTVRMRVSFLDGSGHYCTQYYNDKTVAEDADLLGMSAGDSVRADAALDADPTKATVSGTITDANTGEPVPYASVYWSASGYDMSGYAGDMSGYTSGYAGDISGYGCSGYAPAITDQEGHYSLRGIPAGRPVIVRVESDSYPVAYFDGKASWQNADVMRFEPGEDRWTDLALKSWGAISGTVTDEKTGEPIQNITVEVYSDQYMSGTAPWGVSGYPSASGYLFTTAVTDSAGKYEVPGVNPYAHNLVRFVDESPAGRVSEWYDDSTAFQGARTLTVDGVTPTIADAALAWNPDLGWITGTTRNSATGKPIAGIQVQVYTAELFPMMLSGMSGYDTSGYATAGDLVDTENTSSDGSYRVYGLSAGQPYVVKFHDPLGRTGDVWYATPGSSDPLAIIIDGSGDPMIASADLDVAAGAPPVTQISALPEEWVNHDVTFGLQATGDDWPFGISSFYGLNGPALAPYLMPVTIADEGTTTIQYFSADPAGMAEDVQTASVYIDKTAPVTTDNHGASYSGTATIDLAASDPLSGIDELSWILDGQPGTGTVVTTGQLGDHTLSYHARDVAGNVEGEHLVSFEIVDDTAPVTTSDAPSAWQTHDVSVSLSASDSGSGVSRTYWALDASDLATYSASIDVIVEGTSTLSFFSVDNAGNEEATKTATVRIDKTAPSAPSDLSWTSLTPSEVRLHWTGAADAVSGIAGYRVYGTNGAIIANPSGHTAKLDLTPGASYQFSVAAVDVAGNVSATSAPLTVVAPVPPSSASAAVSAGESVTVDASMTIGGVTGTATVTFESVTDPGTLTITRTHNAGGHDIPGGQIAVGRNYYDVTFSGSFSGAITVTLPYDPAIPDSQATAMTVMHWNGSAWEDVKIGTDTVSHTVTLRLTSLSPVVYLLDSSADTSTVTEARFASGSTSIYSKSGSSLVIQGRVKDASGTVLDQTVKTAVLEASPDRGGTWVTVPAVPVVSEGWQSFTVAPTADTQYRVVFADDGFNSASMSSTLTVTLQRATTLTKPKLSVSSPKRSKRVTFSTTLTPGNASSAAATRLVLYRLETRTVTKTVKGIKKRVEESYWHKRYTWRFSTAASGRLSVSGKLRYKGKWKAVAQYSGCDAYAASASAVAYFRVK
jgi:5-hydroxyisourate hydrolase-like protein (transthyretin family)